MVVFPRDVNLLQTYEGTPADVGVHTTRLQNLHVEGFRAIIGLSSKIVPSAYEECLGWSDRVPQAAQRDPVQV